MQHLQNAWTKNDIIELRKKQKQDNINQFAKKDASLILYRYVHPSPYQHRDKLHGNKRGKIDRQLIHRTEATWLGKRLLATSEMQPFPPSISLNLKKIQQKLKEKKEEWNLKETNQQKIVEVGDLWRHLGGEFAIRI